ncbi:sulfotransferase family protein [Roseovarius pacificus]|uniref:sulfotransferase family protein n=1 Tax=Roseovarius pacificus TaxID=337701 RepID=UPI002599F22B|nr:sulfotransferase family protein [Roseovarius pacificus]
METREYLKALFANRPATANYLVHWTRGRNYIYVETPKVACTTIKHDLQMDATGEPVTGNVHDRDASPLLRITDAPGEFKALNDDPDTFKFCFVRNPFSRALSCYLDKFVTNEWERQRLSGQLGFDPETPPTFIEFLEAVRAQDDMERDIHWATQTFLLRPRRYKYSFIGRFELFGPQFESIKAFLGINVPSRNVSRHATGASGKLDEFMTENAVSLIKEIYEFDFNNFGYGWSHKLL